jgi:transposase
VIVKEYMATHLGMMLEWLPPYAPALNPEEGCHGNTKQHLHNAAPLNSSDLHTQVDRGFARLRRCPDLLLAFSRRAGLAVNQLW